jgi:hypothetical protein
MIEQAIKNMTLRDYFAAKAMQALLSEFEYGQSPSEIQEDFLGNTAEQAYAVADKMLEARNYG